MTPAWPEWSDNSAKCYELAIACLRERHLSQEPLTPAEMIERVDRKHGEAE